MTAPKHLGPLLFAVGGENELPYVEQNWEGVRRRLLSQPSSAGLAIMCEAVEPGGEVVRVRRLGGGLGGATHAIDVSTYRQMRRRLVLKRYPAGHPTIAREWRGLEVARDLEVPSPEPVVLDADGTWFGTPALVMTRLPGRAEVAQPRVAQ